MFDLKGRIAIVTGGNGGIGLGMARGLAGAGAGVVVVGRNAEKSKAAVQELGKLGAETLVMLTGVDRVALDFGRPSARWLDSMTAAEAERHLADGQFPPGSMGP